MALSPGTWLNHYEVLGHLGTGGMGEVYRARDNKLQRDVALKVLPKAFAQDPERVARFRREAQVLAQVNHPNIAGIYSVEESGGTHFLVMELAQGETLRDRIKRGPVPIEEALDIAKQIAAGIEAAHEKPIVHRDLKPANVKVTPEGVVKILDFGLARAFAGGTGSGDPADSPTLTGMTAPGTILGTAAYMSPEQARGKKVDKRTDIWALGCVLYEMLTGKRAFDGEDVTEIIAAVVKAEPDWSTLPKSTPPHIRFVLRRCLEKDAKRRFHAATDVAIALEEAWSIPAPAPPTPEPAPLPAPPLWRRALPYAIAVLITALVTSLGFWNLRPIPSLQSVSRVVIPLPPEEQLQWINDPSLAISPDGTHLAYIGFRGGVRGLSLRAMDTMETMQIPDTQGTDTPFFSPDGQWLGFFSDGKLKKIAVSGGTPLTLAEAPNLRGATWGPNDTIVFNPTNPDVLFQISASGGEPQQLTTLKEGEVSHQWPHFLPNGQAVLFTVATGGSSADSHIAALRMDTGEQKVLIPGGSFPQYVPTGHLVYYRRGTIMAAAFDPVRLEMLGTPAPALEGVLGSPVNTGAAQFSFSPQGSLVYLPGSSEGAAADPRTMVWVDRKGAETPLPAPPRPYGFARVSPDGQQVALLIGEGAGDIWVYDILRSSLTRLTFEGASNTPLWTPDGKKIVFLALRSGALGLYWKPADGSGDEERLTTFPDVQLLGGNGQISISPDGRVVVYSIVTTQIPNSDIWTLPLEGDRTPKLFLQTRFSERAPVFSPDGRWLAYISNESGRDEIYVQPYPGPGGKFQVSTDGGIAPVWARNGRELFYREGGTMMVVEITTQPTFRAGTPRMLFGGGPNYPNLPMTPARFDVSPDGQRFLMLKASGQQVEGLTQINMVLNWFEDLKQRVPPSR